MYQIQKFLDSINNQNTKQTHKVVLKKLEEYLNLKHIEVSNIGGVDVNNFLLENYYTKSKKTQACALSSLNAFFTYLNTPEVMKGITLPSIVQASAPKEARVFSPVEIAHIMAALENIQDKALIALIYYCNIYDQEFSSIRNLKMDDVSYNSVNISGKTINISEKIYDILTSAFTETIYIKYEPKREIYLTESDYIMRTGSCPIKKDPRAAVSSLKARLGDIGDLIGSKHISAITIKNSRLIYEIIKYEHEFNNDSDLTAAEIKEIFGAKYNFCVEAINPLKKKAKTKILTQIIDGRDIECQLNGQTI